MFCDYVLLKIVIVKCIKLTFVKIKQSAMKRTFWHFLAVLTLTLMLVSCGKDNISDSPSQEEPGTEEPKPEEQKPEEESKPEIIFKLECDWAEGDAVGIYAYDAESKDLVFGNKKLTFNGTGWAGDKLCWEKD